MLGGGVDAATLVAALGAGPTPQKQRHTALTLAHAPIIRYKLLGHHIGEPARQANPRQSACGARP